MTRRTRFWRRKLAQVEGVGQVFVGGAAQPAVRAEVNPMLLNKLGVGLDTVRTALNAANANRAKGQVANGTTSWSFSDNDQLFTADQYRPLIVAYHNGAPVRLGDVADVQDAVSDVRNIGLANGKPGVLIIVFRQAWRQHHRDRGPCDRADALPPVFNFPGDSTLRCHGSHSYRPRLGEGH